MQKTSTNEPADDEAGFDELRIRIRLPAAMGAIYDQLLALPPSQRGVRIQQLIVQGHNFEALLHKGLIGLGMASPGRPEEAAPALNRISQVTESVRRSEPAPRMSKPVADARSASIALALERIGSPMALLPTV